VSDPLREFVLAQRAERHRRLLERASTEAPPAPPAPHLSQGVRGRERPTPPPPSVDDAIREAAWQGRAAGRWRRI
jgi:hypothetical protein